MKSCDVSIILPCYNYARYLREALDSIVTQNETDYELILVDDGSTDESWQIIEEYAARFSRIRPFKNKSNLGIFKTNDRAWSEARGEYLFFFGADDILYPGCLAKVMRLFHDNPHLGLVCTDIEYFKDGMSPMPPKKLLTNCLSPRLFSKNEMIALFQTTQFSVPGSTCVVKQEILKKYGHLDPKLENISDWFCFHKIALFEGVGYVPETLISMRLHDQTYTARVKKDKARKRATYNYLLQHLSHEKETRELFKQSGLLSFVFRELYWKLRLNPRYFGFWPYLKKQK